MKRAAFSWAFLFSFVFLSAQTNLFFNGGATYSLLQQPKVVIEEIKFESRFSRSFSAGVRTSLTEHAFLAAGIDYTGYTTHISQFWGSAGASGTTTYDLNLKYYRLSVKAEYFFGPEKIGFVGLGPFFSVLHCARVNGTWDGRRVDGYIIHSEFDESLYHDLRHFDVGLSANAGIRLNVDKGIFISPQLGASYSFVALKKMETPDGGSTLTAHYQGIHMRALYFLIELDIQILGGKD
jgi:hypothetical protein